MDDYDNSYGEGPQEPPREIEPEPRPAPAKGTIMDPNQALADAREAAKKVDALDGADDIYGELIAANDALTAYRNLDDWLTKGGFLPTEWHREGL